MTTKTYSLGQLIAAGSKDPHEAALDIDSEFYQHDGQGAHFRLPTKQFGIDATTSPGGQEVRRDPDPWPIERATSLLDRMSVYTVEQKQGRLPVGVPPTVSMEGETTTQSADSDPVLNETAYSCDSVVEARSSYTLGLAARAATHDIGEEIEAAHRQAIRKALLTQIVSGDGQGQNLLGILNQTGIGAGTYQAADRGKWAGFLDVENIVEDADADRGAMAWLLHSGLYRDAQNTSLDSYGARFTIEGGEMAVSGYRTFRSKTAIPADTALLADWSSIVLAIHGDLSITIDRVSIPGVVTVTSRLPVADPVLVRPVRVYKLEQA